MNAPVFSITIPTYRHHQGLERLLATITANTVRPHDIVIIDNGCDLPDGEHPIPSPISYRLIRPGRNIGVAGGWNLGIRLAETADVVVMNDDILLAQDALEKIVSAPPAAGMVFTRHPRTGVAGGYTCYMIRKWFYDRQGEFDEGFYPAYLEDSDYTQRFILSGLPGETFHCVDVEIEHATAGRGNLSWVKDGWARNHQRFIAKWGFDPHTGHAPDKGFRHPWNRA